MTTVAIRKRAFKGDLALNCDDGTVDVHRDVWCHHSKTVDTFVNSVSDNSSVTIANCSLATAEIVDGLFIASYDVHTLLPSSVSEILELLGVLRFLDVPVALSHHVWDAWKSNITPHFLRSVTVDDFKKIKDLYSTLFIPDDCPVAFRMTVRLFSANQYEYEQIYMKGLW